MKVINSVGSRDQEVKAEIIYGCNCGNTNCHERYIVWLDKQQKIVLEWLCYDTLVWLQYYPLTKQSFIWLNGRNRKTTGIIIDQLTPSVVHQWLERLKLYVVMS